MWLLYFVSNERCNHPYNFYTISNKCSMVRVNIDYLNNIYNNMKPNVRIYYVAVFVIGTKALSLLTDQEIAMLYI